MSQKAAILGLYRRLLAESKRFTSYNYREHSIRRIREEFKHNKHVQDSTEVAKLVRKAEKSLATIQRQVLVGMMYAQPKIVVEK
eukprot:m.311388 g.311388  ORF g.311388 m.311388 type:complete len:84 (+) comp67481_c0_seq1:27-278(+)